LVLGPQHRRRTAGTGKGPGSAARAAAGALRIGHTMKAAIGSQRILAPAPRWVAALLGLMLLAATTVAVRWPLLVALPTALLTGWVGIAFLVRAYELGRDGLTQGDPH
jgi:cardiolipin synthase A/B